MDVLPGEGGFGCIPGSHRPDYPWPEQFSRGERDAWRFPDEERSPGSSSGGWWAEELGVIAVAGEEPVRAGDCILFTEKVRASPRNPSPGSPWPSAARIRERCLRKSCTGD